jgi:putative peptidoglycan lipid II flippase
VVIGAFLASRVLGWLRVIVLANYFGAGADLDAYYAAFRIPDLMFQLVAAGAVASALVPVLSGLLVAGQRERASRVASTVANLMLGVLLLLSLLMIILADRLVPWLVPGFDAQTTALTVELTRVMLVSPVFLAAGAIASSLLNTEGRFGAAAMAPALYNVCIIGATMLLGPALGVMAAALGVVAGSVAHLAVQLPFLRGRFRYDRGVDMGDEAARQSFWLMLPRAIGMGANQITFLVNTILATTLGVGAVVSYTVAFNVLQIPLGIVGLPLGIVLLPSLSRAMAEGREAEFGRLVVGTLRLLLWATLFIAAVGLVARTEIVALLFGRGFDAAALAATAATLAVLLLGLPAHSLNIILARAFYSAKDTLTPVAVAVASVAINVAISLLSVDRLGLQGLALGIAVGAWFESLTLTLILLRRSPSIDGRSIVVGGLVSLGGAALAGVAAMVTLGGLAGSDAASGSALVTALRLTAAGVVAGLVYLLYSRIVRLPELPRTLSLLRSALRPG